jgi:O-antigen ligase
LKIASFLSPFALLLAAFVLIQCVLGGTRPVHGLPVFALLGVATLLTRRTPFPGLATVSRPCLAATAGLFSYLILRAALSPVPYLARADLFLMLACLVVYLLTALYLVTARQRMIVVSVLLSLGLVHVIIGVIQTALGDDFMLFGFMRSPSGSRASGLYISPNHFAGFLEMAGVLALSVAWWSTRKPAMRIFAGWTSLCCFVGVLLSQSRGGILCACVALAAWGAISLWTHALKNPQGLSRAFIGVAIAVGLVAGIGGWVASHNAALQDRFANAFSKDIRVSNWTAANMQFHTAPVFGTGAGTHLYLGRLYRQPELQSDPIHAHNDYLELLAEYGLVGGVGMAIFLGLHVVRGFGSLRPFARLIRERGDWSRDELALVIGALAAVAGIAAHSFIDFNMHIPGNALVMAFLFGILAQPGTPEEAPADSPVSAAGRVALPILGGALVLLSVAAWPGELFTERARVHVRRAQFAIEQEETDVARQEYASAVASAQRARRLDPWNPFTAFHLGEAARLWVIEEEDSFERRQALREQANQAYLAGLRIFPQDENLLVRRGQVLGELKRFDEAEASFQAAMAADPELRILKEIYKNYRDRRAQQDDEL